MTDQDLRTLLHDLALDLTAQDQPGSGVDRAWREGSARARRGRLAAGASVAAVAAAVSSVVVLTNHAGNPPATPVGPAPGPDRTSAPASGLPGGSRPDGTFEGTRVFWGPTPEQESRLPELDRGRPPLPAVIDLGGAVGPGRIDRAVAAFGLGNEAGTGLATVRLLAEDGTWRDLDVGRLAPVAEESSDFYVPIGATSLSPSGTRLAFVQPDSVSVYEVASQEWTDVAWPGVRSVAWEDDTHLRIPGAPGTRGEVVSLAGRVTSVSPAGTSLPGQQAYGPRVSGWTEGTGGYDEHAQAYYAIAGLPVPAGTTSNPEAALVSVGTDAPLLLAWPDSSGGRVKGCCRPATWLPSGQIVFDTGARLLSWVPGTHDFRRVSVVRGMPQGSFTIASWADLSR